MHLMLDYQKEKSITEWYGLGGTDGNTSVPKKVSGSERSHWLSHLDIQCLKKKRCRYIIGLKNIGPHSCIAACNFTVLLRKASDLNISTSSDIT